MKPRYFSGEDVEERGFAAARGAHDRRQLAHDGGEQGRIRQSETRAREQRQTRWTRTLRGKRRRRWALSVSGGWAGPKTSEHLAEGKTNGKEPKGGKRHHQKRPFAVKGLAYGRST